MCRSPAISTIMNNVMFIHTKLHLNTQHRCCLSFVRRSGFSLDKKHAIKSFCLLHYLSSGALWNIHWRRSMKLLPRECCRFQLPRKKTSSWLVAAIKWRQILRIIIWKTMTFIPRRYFTSHGWEKRGNDLSPAWNLRRDDDEGGREVVKAMSEARSTGR